MLFLRPLRRASLLYSLAPLVLAAAVGAASAQDKAAAYPFVFRDAGQEAGLFPALTGIMGHAAGWGDVDGDGWADLYVGTFAQNGAPPNVFLRNSGGKFRVDDQPALKVSSRATGTLFADLDNDGDLDFYIGSMPRPKTENRGCALFRNDGGGKFTDISQGNGACPEAFGGRSATVLDYDGDGLLDLLVGEDPIPGYNGSKTKSSRLFHNDGGLKFTDVTQAVGIPADIAGLGVAAADVNNDSWPDLFLAAPKGSNALFLNDGHGKFREAPGREVFSWEGAGEAGGDNMVCGVCFGDVNRDGLLDLVLGQHYSQPWVKPVSERMYLNRGLSGGDPRYEDVSAAVGLKPLPMKAPHVELQDLDNDGWPDLYVSQVKLAGGKCYPVIFKHLGLKDGLPQFREDALAVNDFPTDEDRATKKTGEFFAKMIQDNKIIYMAPGPTCDYDNDGKLDIFLANWWVERPSLLLHNETPGGHWLQVRMEGGQGINRMGIGSKIRVYPAGKLGDAKSLVGCAEIATGFGYASSHAAITHFGLGALEAVDLEVILPHGKGRLEQKGVKADQRITLKP